LTFLHARWGGKALGMTEEAIYGWLVTVDRPGASPEVYNVAIREERLAVMAVKRVLHDPEDAIIKVKSKLTKQLYIGLKMKPGDVMLGARRKHPKNPAG
jgi:hypothetical protein